MLILILSVGLPHWRYHAETVAMLTFSGFHADRPSRTSLVPPIASTEVRRRIVCQIYVMDKLLATLVGRPPLLTRRFCAITIPLDLDDTALLSDKQTFQKHLLKVDAEGWALNGEIRSTSILRVRTKLALVRDEILEVRLSYSEEYGIDDILYEMPLLIPLPIVASQ